MVSHSVLNTRVAEIVTCSICLEDFNSPRSLPCLHSFCLKCLQGYWDDKSPGDGVSCPLCGAEFQIPWNGLESLRVNFVLKNLIDAQNVSSRASESCGVCCRETASVYCVDCSQKLCGRCNLPHKKMRAGNHDVRPLPNGSPNRLQNANMASKLHQIS